MTKPAGMEIPWTAGIHHVGLTVGKLEETAGFFREQLGWKEVRRDPGYPSIFVSDGQVLITLWQAKGPFDVAGFDRFRNIGLHHLALRLRSLDDLMHLHGRLQNARGVRIEFAPQPLRGGPTMHMICYEPSGIRVEFIVPAGI